MRATFRRGGVTLAVRVAGSGRPMLFQHGLCGDAGQAAEVVPPGWRGITLECRGHGGSELGPLDTLSLATFAKDLEAFLDDLALGPMVLGGISMGAALALRLAVHRPDLASGLILARPAWLCAPAPENLEPYALVGELLGRHPPEEARAIFEAGETARKLAVEAPDNLASLLGFFSREPLAVTRALLSRIPADGPGVMADDLARLTVPTLAIGHGRDHAHPLAIAEALAGMIPAARLVRIAPKAGDRALHVAELRAALADFLG